jgi:dihydroxy-acid dehydratase
MPRYRSRTTTEGRNMAGARALWRATGMKDEDFRQADHRGGQLLHPVRARPRAPEGPGPAGRARDRKCRRRGEGVQHHRVDDGIAMGHDGMLYSLPSRDLIADSVEYMVNAHCADALVCISNCDKITPGMLMAALRLNIPVVFVSGGPMEAGKTKLSEHKLDLIDAMVIAGRRGRQRRDRRRIRTLRLPHLRLLLRHVHRQLDELPDRSARAVAAGQRHRACHPRRPRTTVPRGRPLVVELCTTLLRDRTTHRCCRATSQAVQAFENAMTLDIAMGGSTNTILHLLAAAQEAGVDFTHGRHRPPVAPRAATVQGGAQHAEVPRRRRAPRRRHHGILGELDRAGLLHTDVPTVHSATLADALARWDIMAPTTRRARSSSVPDRPASRRSGLQPEPRAGPVARHDRAEGCIRSRNTPSRRKAALPCSRQHRARTAAW